MVEEKVTKLIPLNSTKCECPHCREGQFIKRIASLLPESDGKELTGWYNALIDCKESDGMEFYWIEYHLKEMTNMIKAFGERRA